MAKLTKKAEDSRRRRSTARSCTASMKRSRPPKANATSKFDETIEVAVNLGVDPRHADQMVRGVVTLPKGTGKTVRVGVFAKGAKADEAREAGADVVGAEDLMEIVQGGTIDFDRCIATPDMMGVVGRLGKISGPKGMMPNPKLGTVTMNVAEAVKAAKGGQIEYRVEKAGIIHSAASARRASRPKTCARTSTHWSMRWSRPSPPAPRQVCPARSRSARPWARASRSTPPRWLRPEILPSACGRSGPCSRSIMPPAYREMPGGHFGPMSAAHWGRACS